LRDDKEALNRLKEKEQSIITSEQGEKLAKEVGAIAYVEVSSKKNIGIVKCFETVVASSYVHQGGADKRHAYKTTAANSKKHNEKKCNVQ